MSISFKGVFPYPPMFDGLADELAKLRSKLSEKFYKQGTDKYRGDREHEISKRGILGELIARDYLALRPIKFSAAPLVDVVPHPTADLVVNECRDLIDVKTVKEDGPDFLVNHPAHNNKDKSCDYYWFVKLERNFEASHYLISSSDVDSWEIVKFTFTKAYRLKIPSL